MEKNIIEDLKKYLISCIDKEGIIDGKRMFALKLGKVENDLFNNIDEVQSTIYNFADYSKDAYLEELPIVDEYDFAETPRAVSL